MPASRSSVDDRHVLLLVPAPRQLAAVHQPLVLLGPAPAPRLDALGQLGERPRVARPHAVPRIGRQRHALEEDALVALERQVGAQQVVARADARDDLGHARVDVVAAQRASDRDAVVAVLDEVDVADAVEVDGRHRLAAAHRGGDPLPARADLRRRGAEVAVKALHPVDGPDDCVERDDRQADVALLHAPERGDDLVERQDVVDVARLAAQPAPQPRQRQPPTGTQEVVLCVGARTSRCSAVAHPARYPVSEPTRHRGDRVRHCGQRGRRSGAPAAQDTLTDVLNHAYCWPYRCRCLEEGHYGGDTDRYP